MSRRTTIVLLVVSILVLANAGIAFGKGPESATLAGSGIDSPIELMDAVDWPISCDGSCPPDPMVRLMEQTGIWYGVGDLPVPIDPPDGELGNRYVLTWSRGGSPGNDIRQFIYLDAEDGPVIHTPAQESLEGWGSGAVGWFRASDGLPDTVVSLGAPLSDAGVGGFVAIGVPERLRLLAAIGAAALLPMWGFPAPDIWAFSLQLHRSRAGSDRPSARSTNRAGSSSQTI